MVVTRATRNRFVGVEPARGFESHHLRQKPITFVLSVFYFTGFEPAVPRKNTRRVHRRHKYPLVRLVFFLPPPPCICHRQRSAPSPTISAKNAAHRYELLYFAELRFFITKNISPKTAHTIIKQKGVCL